MAQSMAFPSRRVVELARRFDEYPACNGQPCRNGLVASICASELSSAREGIVQLIRSRLESGRCLSQPLRIVSDTNGNDLAEGVLVREYLPEGQSGCDPARGRTIPELEADRIFVDPTGVTHSVCDISQVSTIPATGPVATRYRPVSAAVGWYYDRTEDPADRACTQRISFAPGGGPAPGAIVRLECIQALSRGR